MTFNSKYDEIKLLLHLSEARQQQDYKIIRDALDEMKQQFENRIQSVGNGDSS